MKKRFLLITLMVAIFVFVLALATSAASYKYVDESGNEYLKTEVDENGIITSYEGKGFPMWNEAGAPLCWYLISETDTVKTVKSFVSTDPIFTNHGNGYFRFIQEKDFTLKDSYPVPTKANIVSINMPNDCGITAFSDYSQVGIYANTGDYKPENTELLFARFPNTLTNSSRLVQATTVLEVYFDENITGLTTIGQVAFHGCKSLRKVEIPACVTKIDGTNANNGTAFYNCYSLNSITFAEGSQLEELGSYVFNNCKSLTEIYFPNTLKKIGNNAFEGAINLKKLSLGSTYTSLTQSLTYGTAVQYMYVPNTITSASSSHNFWAGTYSGVSVPNSIVFFAGTLDEAKALNDLIGNKNNQKFWTSDYSNMIEWDPTMSDDDYVAKAVEDGKNYVVYGYNKCKAFYGSTHAEDTHPCLIQCTRCGLSEQDPNANHTFATVIEYENGFTVVGKKTQTCQNTGCECNVKPIETQTEAILSGFGYSTRIKNETASGLVFSYLVNRSALVDYETANETTVALGVLAVAEHKAADTVVNADGTAAIENVVAAPVGATSAVDLIIWGSPNAWEATDEETGKAVKDIAFYFSAYVIEGENVSYVCGVTSAKLTDMVKKTYTQIEAEMQA